MCSNYQYLEVVLSLKEEDIQRYVFTTKNPAPFNLFMTDINFYMPTLFSRLITCKYELSISLNFNCKVPEGYLPKITFPIYLKHQSPFEYEMEIQKEKLLKNSVDNMFYKGITFKGGMQDDLKETVANTGGVTCFRYAIENLGNFVSNEADEVVYNGLLLGKVGITLDQVKSNISFDMIIKTTENITYKGTIKIDTPVGDIVKDGQSNIEITDFKDVVFKRVSE